MEPPGDHLNKNKSDPIQEISTGTVSGIKDVEYSSSYTDDPEEGGVVSGAPLVVEERLVDVREPSHEESP